MALSYTSISGGGGATTGFAIDTGDGTKTDVTLTKEYPAGGYQVSSANGNQGLFIFFGASDGTPAGGTSSKSIVATKAFNKLTIIGVTANDLITFTYKETATLNAVGTSSTYSGAVVTSFSPNQVSAINDTLILNGAALGANVTVKFTGANNTPLNAKSITRVSDTQLIVTRPDIMPGDQDPYKITVQNPGIEPAVSTSTVTQPLYAGSAPTWSTAATLPAFTKNISYTQQLVASDPDSTAVTYSFVNGSLPAGLTYATNSSIISGTPTGSTAASFTIRATEASGRYTDRTFLLPNAYPVFTTGPTLPSYTKNVAYSTTVVASDDSGVSPSLSVVGTVPTGLSFNALTGSVTGTMGFSTNQTFTIRATDANGSTTDQTFTIPNTGPTWVTSTSLPVYTKNVAYSTTVVATDDGTLTYSLISGSLPSGISLSSAGVISGTTQATTNHSITVRSQDDAGNYADRTFTLNNVGASAPTWTTSGAITQAVNGLSYSYQLVASDDSGIAPTYSIATGSLPTGLALSSSGLISGTPTVAGTYTITVRATDTNSSSTVSSNISLVVAQTISAALTATYGTTDYTLAAGNISVFDFRNGYANGNRTLRTYAKGGNGGSSSARGGYGTFLQGDIPESYFIGKVVALVSATSGGEGAGGRGSAGGGGYSGWIQIDPSDITNKKCLTHIFTAAGGGGAAGPGDANTARQGLDTSSIVYSGSPAPGTPGTGKNTAGTTGIYPSLSYSARPGNAYGGGDGCSDENTQDNFPPGSSGGFGPLAGGLPNNASGPGILGGNTSAGPYGGSAVVLGGYGGGGAATNGGSGSVPWRVCSGGGGGGGFIGGNGGTYSGDGVPNAGGAGTSYSYLSGIVTTHTTASSAAPYARVQIV